MSGETVIEISSSDDDIEITEIHMNNCNPKVKDVTKTLLFIAMSEEITKFTNTESYKKNFQHKKSSGLLSDKEKEEFLRFLYESRFLCEVINPSLSKILCQFNFLGRKETLPYENFITALRFDISKELESLFTRPSDESIKSIIYENLRNKFH